MILPGFTIFGPGARSTKPEKAFETQGEGASSLALMDITPNEHVGQAPISDAPTSPPTNVMVGSTTPTQQNKTSQWMK
jgi:hypothetical protein